MLIKNTTFFPRLLRSINSFAPIGAALEGFDMTKMSRSNRLIIAVLLYVLSIGSAFLLFDKYSTLFATQALLTSNTGVLLRTFLEPVLYLTLCLYFFTLGIVLARTILPIVLISILFASLNKLTLNSIISNIIIFAAFLIYYFQFFKNFSELKKPTIFKAFNSSLAIFIALISLAISINYYHDFTARIDRISTKLGTTISQHFADITNNYNSETSSVSRHETLRTRAIRDLKLKNIAIDEVAITRQEQELIRGLRLTTAKPTDEYRSLLDRAIKHEVATTINTYNKILMIIVPFAFFFITDVLANVSAYIAVFLLMVTEWGLRRKGLEN